MDDTNNDARPTVKSTLNYPVPQPVLHLAFDQGFDRLSLPIRAHRVSFDTED
jgi:hypothetical protein